MNSVTQDRQLVNETADFSCPETCSRRYEQLGRVLGLVDMMAPLRAFKSTYELCHLYNERHGTQWTFRTFLRDLRFLEEAGLVDVETQQNFPSPTRCLLWRLNLQRSEAAQQTAIAVIDSPADVAPSPKTKRDKSWDVWIVDAQLGETRKVWSGLSKREVLARQKLWSESRTGCVLIAWPKWQPTPDFLQENDTIDDSDNPVHSSW